jgi:hypothetical protein
MVLERLEADHIGTVFLHGRWALYTEGYRYGQEPGGSALITADLVPEHDYQEFDILFRRTIEELQRHNATIIIIASVPEISEDVPTMLARSAIARPPVTPDIPYSDFLNRQARSVNLFSQLADKYGVRVIYPHTILCDERLCSIVKEHHAFYVDFNHLSLQGATFID